MHRTLLSILLFLPFVAAAPGQRIQAKIVEKPARTWPTSFAILVDLETYKAAGDALKAYKAAVEEDGLSAHLIADAWKHPEQVRDIIAQLHRAPPPLEGAALVGRIPVAMIRDAQHLTSAFKMDQKRFPFRRSSVPSDRFYEDLDLSFTFLRKDPENPLLFYYSLSPDSPQRIQKEIYSGRILPGQRPDPARLRAYLEKVVRRKKENRPLVQAKINTGHGYNSSSMAAWQCMNHMFREQMPWLHRPGGRVVSLYHSESPDLKAAVMMEIQRPDLNLLVFHAHGSPDKQYLLGAPLLPSMRSRVDAIKRYLRNRLRRAKRRKKDVEKEKAALVARWGVPEAWFKGAFDSTVEAEDEKKEEAKTLRVKDLKGVSPVAEVVVFDECFNGRFIDEEYIAGAYVFGPGGTVAAVANTVNVLQDVWADECLGLLGYGMRLGRYHRFRNHLESHIIGDPTFRFRPRKDTVPADLSRCKQLILDTNAPAALRAQAARLLFGDPARTRDSALKHLCLRDPMAEVRLAALKCLAAGRTEWLGEVLEKTVTDPCEMIRRQSVRLIGDLGRPDHIALLLRAEALDESRRVSFQARTALNRYPPASILKVLADGTPDIPTSAKEILRKRFGNPSRFLGGDLTRLGDRTAGTKKRIQSIRTFRLYRLQEAVTGLTNVARDEKDEADVRVVALEALGWYVFSDKRPEILEAVKAVETSKDAPEAVRLEARKTRRRLEAGPNDPFTP